MIVAAVFLALASFVVALLRRGRLGRRLIALRDSEAAYAMLGGNLLLAQGDRVRARRRASRGSAARSTRCSSSRSWPSSSASRPGCRSSWSRSSAGSSSVGAGLFTGTALVGPINALTEVAAGLHELHRAAARPGRHRPRPQPERRHPADAHATGSRSRGARPLLAGVLVVIAALWALRLAGVVNGWVLFWGCAVVALAAQHYAKSRAGNAAQAQQARGAAPDPARGAAPALAEGAAPAQGAAEVPVEWWGLRRSWNVTMRRCLTVPSLEVSDVTVTFGGKRALDSAGLTAEPGQITGLIGPNGAGKSHPVRRDLRAAQAGQRTGHAGRQGRHAAGPAKPGQPRDGPHVPAARTLRTADRAGEPAGRRRVRARSASTRPA